MSEKIKAGSFVSFCYTGVGGIVHYPIARVEKLSLGESSGGLYTIGLDIVRYERGCRSQGWIAAKKEEVTLLEDQGAAQAIWELQDE